MTPEEKKRDEFRLLRCVYDVDGFESVTPSERPDFIIRPGGTRGLFGVEVTEIFQSESDARLDRLPGYAAQLFAGGEPRHKDDYAALSLDTVSILEPDGTVKEADIPAIVRDMPTVDEYRSRIIAAIEVK